MILVGYVIGLCLLTVLLESIPVLFVGDRGAWWRASVICNIITNPPLNMTVLLLSAYLSDTADLTPFFLLAEIAVVLTEALLYRRMLHASRRFCLIFSLIANALSFGMGWFASLAMLST